MKKAAAAAANALSAARAAGAFAAPALAGVSATAAIGAAATARRRCCHVPLLPPQLPQLAQPQPSAVGAATTAGGAVPPCSRSNSTESTSRSTTCRDR